MTIDIQIKDQQVITEKTRFIVANSVNVVTARCTFDEEWDGAVKHLVFTNGDVSRTVVVTDGEEFAVPYEVLMAGKLEISAVGFGAHGEKRITTKKMQRPLLVHESGEIRGGEAMEYTPALWEKISAFIGNFAELEVDADSLVEAVNLIAKAGTADDVVLQKDDSGFFQTAEEEGDGAVYYLHDKKTLAESRNIIKLTKDKLSFSNDGGEIYPYVFEIDSADFESMRETLSEHTQNRENPHGVTAQQIGAVTEGRKINGHALDKDIELTASDVGALSASMKINGKVLSGDIELTALDVGAVSASRKINGKTLLSDVTLTAADVGAEVVGKAAEAVNAHNSNEDAHGDIRALVQSFGDRLNALANSDDTSLDQLSEIIGYIKNNKELIEEIMADRLSDEDIINNLTTAAADKPLGASQGKVLKDLLDGHFADKKNPHGITLAQIGAAPSGYGLGGAVMFDAANIDDIQAPGWYRTTNITIGANTFNYGYMHVDAYNNTAGIQTMYILGPVGVCLRRIRYGSEWDTWEWVIPPMNNGSEYKMAERHKAKPVYSCRINTGALPASSTATFTLPSAPTEIVHLSGLIKGATTALFPVIGTDGTVRAVLRKTGTQNITVHTFTDLSGYTAQIDVKYTKE